MAHWGAIAALKRTAEPVQLSTRAIAVTNVCGRTDSDETGTSWQSRGTGAAVDGQTRNANSEPAAVLTLTRLSACLKVSATRTPPSDCKTHTATTMPSHPCQNPWRSIDCLGVKRRAARRCSSKQRLPENACELLAKSGPRDFCKAVTKERPTRLPNQIAAGGQ